MCWRGVSVASGGATTATDRGSLTTSTTTSRSTAAPGSSPVSIAAGVAATGVDEACVLATPAPTKATMTAIATSRMLTRST